MARGPGRPLVDDLLSQRSIASIPALDPAGVSAAVAEHMSGRRSYGFELWGLAVLVAWHRRYVQERVAVPGGPAPRLVEIRANAVQD